MKLTEYRIGDVMALVRRPVNVITEETYHEIGLRSFGNGVFHKPPVSGEELGSKRVFHINPGDLLFSNVLAWEGAVALASEQEASKVGSHRFMTYVVDPRKADRRYLLYYFYGGPGLQAIRRASPGSAGRNKTLGITNFENQSIRLPSLEQQRRVADKLDTLINSINSIESLRVRMLGLQRELRESLIESALDGGAPLVRMGDIVAINRTEFDVVSDETYQAIGMRSFGKGIIRYAPVRGGELSKLRYFTFPEKALALSNIKAWEGAIGVTTEMERGYVASNRFLFYLPVDDRVSTTYLRHYFLSRQGLAKISSKSPGGADSNRTLSIRGFEEIRVPLPSRRVQDRIASTLDALGLRLAAAYERPDLAALRPTLLEAAHSGRL